MHSSGFPVGRHHSTACQRSTEQYQVHASIFFVLYFSIHAFTSCHFMAIFRIWVKQLLRRPFDATEARLFQEENRLLVKSADILRAIERVMEVCNMDELDFRSVYFHNPADALGWAYTVHQITKLAIAPWFLCLWNKPQLHDSSHSSSSLLFPAAAAAECHSWA